MQPHSALWIIMRNSWWINQVTGSSSHDKRSSVPTCIARSSDHIQISACFTITALISSGLFLSWCMSVDLKHPYIAIIVSTEQIKINEGTETRRVWGKLFYYNATYIQIQFIRDPCGCMQLIYKLKKKKPKKT